MIGLLKDTIIRTSTYLDTDRPKGASNPHIGIDYRATVGTPFYSLGDGEVTAIGSTSKGAKFITVQYGNGDNVRFLHINSVADGLKVGSNVLEGQTLGETGATGTNVAHLHVDATDKNGNQVNPEAINYGSITNAEFFNNLDGDANLLAAKKKLFPDSNTSSVNNQTADPDKTKANISNQQLHK